MDNAPMTAPLIRIAKTRSRSMRVEPASRRPQAPTIHGQMQSRRARNTIGGDSTDLVFMALSAAEERQARKRNAAWKAT